MEIDKCSGFCGGVIRAIDNAEKFLRSGEGRLFSLGDIVHNEAELARLQSCGLETIGYDQLSRVAGGGTVLIRAHGEPPQTYSKLEKLGLQVIDCTCPVVLKLQKSIREAYSRLHENGKSGQVIIFGKIGHAEVLGLVGQVDGDALVVENLEQLDDLVSAGLIHTDRDIDIFSQTTMSPMEYAAVSGQLRSYMQKGSVLTIHDTICSQVASRHRQISEFAMSHDVVIFVSGKSSSNGKVLSDLCKNVNIRTYNVTDVSDINKSWFRQEDKVGVCGATSTPKWLLENVAAYIENLQQ